MFNNCNAGANFNTNSKLVIESNPYTNGGSNPLIFGDFEEDFVTITGTLNVTDLFKLNALETAPTCDEESFGALYMNGVTGSLNLCTATGWKAIALEP